jgi:hypothetical protein
MQRYILIILLALIVLLIIYLYNKNSNSTISSNAEVVEFTDEPDDSDHPPSKEELEDIHMNSIAYGSGAIRDYGEIIYSTKNYEYLRGGGGGGGGRSGGGGSGGGGIGMGRGSGGGGIGMGRGSGGGGIGMGRGSGGGISGGMGRGSWGGGNIGYGRGGGRYGWGNYGHRRPWRPSYWRSYPYYYYPYNYNYYYDSSYYPDYASGYTYADYQPVNRFSVRIMDKQASHPYNGRGFPKGFSIIGSQGGNCGISGANLTLQRGVTYEFDIFTSRDCLTGEPLNEPFFFTTDPAGGRDSGRVFNVKPIVNGVLKITPDASTPSRFFYNSSRGSFVGGNVTIA